MTPGRCARAPPGTRRWAGLPEQIDQARAVLGDAMVYRRRRVTSIEVPRGDVEVDVDVENDEDGVYLWGTLVTSRRRPGRHRGGLPPVLRLADCSTRSPRQPCSRSSGSGSRGLRTKVTGAGSSFRAYCYNETHENTPNAPLRRHASGCSTRSRTSSPPSQWVDLLKVFRAHLITGNPVKLKATAPLSGFSWEVDEPAGDESMVQPRPGSRGQTRLPVTGC